MRSFLLQTMSLIKKPQATSALLINEKKYYFLFSLLVFCVYSILSAFTTFITPSEFYEQITGAQVVKNSGISVYIAAALIGGLFLNFITAAIMTVYTPFITGGKLFLRLPVIMAIIPILYSLPFLSVWQFPFFLKILLILIAFGLTIFIAIKNKAKFFALLYCLLMISTLYILCEFFVMLCVFLSNGEIYSVLQYIFSFVTLFYSVKINNGIFNTSSPKSAVAVISALLFGFVLIFSLQSIGLISNESFKALTVL